MTHIKYTYTRPAHCEILISLGEKHPRFPPPPFFPSLATRIKFCKLQQGLNNNRNLSNKIAIPPEEIISDNLSLLRATNFEIREAPFFEARKFGGGEKKTLVPPLQEEFWFYSKGRGKKFSRENFFQLYFCYILYEFERSPIRMGMEKGEGERSKAFVLFPRFEE